MRESGKRGKEGERYEIKGEEMDFQTLLFVFLFLILFLGGARRAEQGRATSSSFPFSFFGFRFFSILSFLALRRD